MSLKSYDASVSLKFVPPKEEKLPRYASYASGVMKSHGDIGAAKNSLNHRIWDGWGKNRVTKHGFILEFIEDGYYVLYEVKPGLTSSSELPWYKSFVVEDSPWGPSRTEKSSFESSTYYQDRRAKHPEKYYDISVAVPMSVDEYVAFRLAVQREQLSEKS